jgi:hypothetical protein
MTIRSKQGSCPARTLVISRGDCPEADLGSDPQVMSQAVADLLLAEAAGLNPPTAMSRTAAITQSLRMVRFSFSAVPRKDGSNPDRRLTGPIG